MNEGNPETTLLAIHESVGITNSWELALFCERKGVSYHDIIDDQTLGHTVRFSNTAWHLRDGCSRSVGLCIGTPAAGYSRQEWLGPQLIKVEFAAWWIARTAALLNIPIRHLSYPQLRSALRGNKSDAGVITHNDYTQATGDGDHIDPRGFPMDVAISLALGTRTTEDDMAAVPQEEWNRVRDYIAIMYGDKAPADRHTARRVDAGYVDTMVWQFLMDNYKGDQVAAMHILVALEKRMNDMGLAILELLKRTGGVPDQWKTIAG